MITQEGRIDTREKTLGSKSQEMSLRMRRSKGLTLGASLSTLVYRSRELGRRAEVWLRPCLSLELSLRRGGGYPRIRKASSRPSLCSLVPGGKLLILCTPLTSESPSHLLHACQTPTLCLSVLKPQDGCRKWQREVLFWAQLWPVRSLDGHRHPRVVRGRVQDRPAGEAREQV